MDQGWRRKAISELRIPGTGKVLDAATGTGDVAIEIATRMPNAIVVGTDISSGMLKAAEEKTRSRKLDSRISYVEADVLQLPFEQDSFDGAVISFGLRNVEDPQKGITELTRVVRPKGRVVVLEFSRPKSALIRLGHSLYLRAIPLLGGLVSGSSAYMYLSSSIRAFTSTVRIEELMVRAGLKNIRVIPLFFGTVSVYVGEK